MPAPCTSPLSTGSRSLPAFTAIDVPLPLTCCHERDPAAGLILPSLFCSCQAAMVNTLWLPVDLNTLLHTAARCCIDPNLTSLRIAVYIYNLQLRWLHAALYIPDILLYSAPAIYPLHTVLSTLSIYPSILTPLFTIWTH